MIKMTKLCTLLAATVLSAGAAWAEVGNHVLRLGTPLPDAHPISQAAVKFAELVAEKSGGKIEVKRTVCAPRPIVMVKACD